MCKRLKFLISFVLLLGVAAGAYAADLEVGCGATYIIPPGPCHEYGDCDIRGTLIVPTGACLICNDRSSLDGCTECGPFETMATIIVEGEMYVNDRFDIGRDHDGQLIVRNGGIFEQCCNSDGLKLPDDSGGCHYIFIDGAGSRMRAVRIEAIPDRDAHIDLCDGACLELENVIESPCYRHDPACWIPDGTLTCCGSTCELIIVPGPGPDGATIWAPIACHPTKASNPDPVDGATGVKSVITEVVLKWTASCDVQGCPMCRHFVYFGDDCQAVEDAPIFEIGWTPPPEYMGWLPGAITEYNVGNLLLWKNYCWRIDEGPMGPIVKGDVWTFTTGCPLIDGDLNLDCLLNLEDYAILLETWGEEQYFPWD
ncbi:MAG: hypothetical protein ACYS83_07790 [Planctomycetota bacterium]|jgi:hypothetical protein